LLAPVEKTEINLY